MKKVLKGVNPVHVLCAMRHGSIALPDELHLLSQFGADYDPAETMVSLLERERNVKVDWDPGSETLDVTEFEERFPGVFDRAFEMARDAQARAMIFRAQLLRGWGKWSIAFQAIGGLLLLGEGGGVIFVESVVPELVFLLSVPGAAYGAFRRR